VGHNIISNTGGTAIDFYSAGHTLNNESIVKNWCYKIIGTDNSGSGIAIDSGLPVTVGSETNILIAGNCINMFGGYPAAYGWNGIDLNCADAIRIEANTIIGGGTSIQVDSGSSPNQAIVLDNLCINPTNNFLNIHGTGAGTPVVDYNQYFTNIAVNADWTPFALNPAFTHDAHSLSTFNNDPKLLYEAQGFQTPASIIQFRPTFPSPVISAGTNLGFMSDILGTPMFAGRNPDIGAVQYPVSRNTILSGLIRLQGNLIVR
jgi:hypothetical protein